MVSCEDLGDRMRCEASAVLGVPRAELRSIVGDGMRFPDMFESVRSVEPSGEIWRVHLGLPFPFPDQILQVGIEASADQIRWTNEGNQLLWHAAEWSFEERVDATAVTYTWTASRWPIPAGTRERLLASQGHNTMWGLALAAKTTPRGLEAR